MCHGTGEGGARLVFNLNDRLPGVIHLHLDWMISI